MGGRVEVGGDFWNAEGWKEAFCRLEVMQKVLELVVNERMSQGEQARGTEEKNKVKVNLVSIEAF